jgi:hypothetical protein
MLKANTFLTLLFAGFAVLIITTSLELGVVARRVPLAVAVPTLVLLMYQTFVDTVSAAGRRLSQPPAALEKRPCRQAPNSQAEEDAPDRGLTERGMVASISLFAIALYLLGPYPAVPLYVLLHLKILGKERWFAAVGTAMAVLGLTYVVFGVLLDVQLYEGRLLHWVALLRR